MNSGPYRNDRRGVDRGVVGLLAGAFCRRNGPAGVCRGRIGWVDESWEDLVEAQAAVLRPESGAVCAEVGAANEKGAV